MGCGEASALLVDVGRVGACCLVGWCAGEGVLATRGRTDMRGLVTAGRCCRLERVRVSRVERGPGAARRTVAGWLLALPPAAGLDEADCVGQSSMTASDQHQPASSRAMATLATVCRFRCSVNRTHRSCMRWLPRSPRTRVAADTSCYGCELPAGAYGRTDPVAGMVVPGGLDEQSAHVSVAGFGDRAERSCRTRGVLRGDEPDEGADGVVGEAVPIAGLDRQGKPGQRADRPAGSLMGVPPG